MLELIAILAAAVSLPMHGEFLLAGQSEHAMGLVETSSVTRQGDTATARVIVAFPRDIPTGGRNGRWAQYVMEYDCRGGRVRQMAAASFTRSGEVLEDERVPSPWMQVLEDTPNEAVFGHVCRGERLPAAGSDLNGLLVQYWSDPDGFRPAPEGRTA